MNATRQTSNSTAMLPPVPPAAQPDVAAVEKPLKAVKTADAKWGTAVMQLGYCMIPSLLLRAQNRLKLTPTELVVLLQLCDFWWDEARKPYPSKDSLATRLGMKPRQVQRHLAALEDKKLVARVPRFDAKGGRTSNIYDLTGLVAQLQALQPDFRELEQKIRDDRRGIMKRGYKRPAPAPREAAK